MIDINLRQSVSRDPLPPLKGELVVRPRLSLYLRVSRLIRLLLRCRKICSSSRLSSHFMRARSLVPERFRGGCSFGAKQRLLLRLSRNAIYAYQTLKEVQMLKMAEDAPKRLDLCQIFHISRQSTWSTVTSLRFVLPTCLTRCHAI